MHPPSFALIAFVLSATIATATEGQQSFKVTTGRADDRVEIEFKSGGAVFAVHSPTGNSSLVVERRQDSWPEKFTVRLYLENFDSFGLADSFRVTSGQVEMEVFPKLQQHYLFSHRLQVNGRVAVPHPRSTYIFFVRDDGPHYIGEDGRPLPRQDAHVTIDIPPAFFEKNPESIRFDWTTSTNIDWWSSRSPALTSGLSRSSRGKAKGCCGSRTAKSSATTKRSR